MPVKGHVLSKDDYIKKYGEIEGINKWNKNANRTKIILDTNNLDAEIDNGNAIRCLECGYITTRLQHTHFTHRCKIKTLKEYKQKHPDAALVAPNLAKNQAITLEKMIQKYGRADGELRWKKYRELQALTNTFQFKAATYGWSEDHFMQFNKSRSCTLPNFVKRHGEKAGLEKWNQYCERQRFTTSEQYFKEKYGEEDGARRFADFSRGRNCIDFKNFLEKEVLRSINNASGKKLSYQVHIPGIPGCFDFGIGKKIIEFNGDYWHCNPIKYHPNFYHTMKKRFAAEIWEYDAKKHNEAISRGYDIMIIWENDWKTKRQETLLNIVRWLNEN